MSRILWLLLGLSVCLAASCPGGIPSEALPEGSETPANQQAPESTDRVLLEGYWIGSGEVLVDPIGELDELGFLYPVGTTVTLSAIESPGWVFLGWYGDSESLDPVIQLTLSSDTMVVAFFGDLSPPATPVPVGAEIFADDGQFLGVINANRFDSDSIANPFGSYGSRFNSGSIWNEFGQYGSSYSSLSAYNSFTSTPPSIYVNGIWDSYLTKNTTLLPRTDPDVLARAVGRPEVARD